MKIEYTNLRMTATNLRYGFKFCSEMVADTLKELRDWVYEKKFPAHMMVNIVFVGKDDLYLSMANGRAIGSFTIIMTK